MERARERRNGLFWSDTEEIYTKVRGIKVKNKFIDMSNWWNGGWLQGRIIIRELATGIKAVHKRFIFKSARQGAYNGCFVARSRQPIAFYRTLHM